jgi:hypothetical protein
MSKLFPDINHNFIQQINEQLSFEIKEPGFALHRLFSLKPNEIYFKKILTKTNQIIQKNVDKYKGEFYSKLIEIKNNTLYIYELNNSLISKILNSIIRNDNNSKTYLNPKITKINLSLQNTFHNNSILLLFSLLFLYVNKHLKIKKIIINTLNIQNKITEYIINAFIEYSSYLESLVIKTNLNNFYELLEKKSNLQKLKICNFAINLDYFSKAIMNLNNIKSISFVDVKFYNEMHSIGNLIVHLVKSKHFVKFQYTHLHKYITNLKSNLNWEHLNHFIQLIPYVNKFIIHDINTHLTNDTIIFDQWYNDTYLNQPTDEKKKKKFVLNALISNFSKYKWFHFEKFSVIDIGPLDQISFLNLIEYINSPIFNSVKELIVRFDPKIFEYDLDILFSFLKSDKMLTIKTVRIFNLNIVDKYIMDFVTGYLYENQSIKYFSVCPYHTYNISNDEGKTINHLSEFITKQQVPVSFNFEIDNNLTTILYALKRGKFTRKIYKLNQIKFTICSFFVQKMPKRIYIENNNRIIYHKFNFKTYNFDT